MKHILIIVFALFLSACHATTKEVVRVEVPVAVGCVRTPVPVAPETLSDALPAIQTEEDASKYAKALKHDLRAFQSYSQELEVVVAGCPILEEKKK